MGHLVKAASILLARGSDSADYFVVHRTRQLRFMGGFLAFPGGKTAPEDDDIPIRAVAPALAPERAATAARELFEETGVLLARGANGAYRDSGPVLDYLRRKMLDENLPFHQVLERLDVTLHADDFRPIGRLITPSFVPARFDTSFFWAVLPPNQSPCVWPGELDEGEWASPALILRRWQQGECLVSPPTVQILEAIQGCPPAQATTQLAPLFQCLPETIVPAIPVAPQVQLIPLLTQALPPSTHTNAYLVGHGPGYLFDPGPTAPEEQAKLFAVLDRQLAAGRALTAIVLTHHHPDHIGAAAACAQRYDLPIWAHPRTAEILRGQLPIARLLVNGDRLDLGTTPDGSAPWFLEALHTPGHAGGHLVFHDPYYRFLLAGDMVSTLSSVVIGPPDGDLAVYLDSLKRLQQLNCRLLLPAHGGPTAQSQEVLEECINHRLKREEQLIAALSAAPRSVEEIAQDLYRGLPTNLQRFAELQVLAGLHKLEREGRAVQLAPPEGSRWQLR